VSSAFGRKSYASKAIKDNRCARNKRLDAEKIHDSPKRNREGSKGMGNVQKKNWDYVAIINMTPKCKGRPRFSRFSGSAYTDKSTSDAEREIKAQVASMGTRTFTSPVEISIECLFLMPKKLEKTLPRGDVDNYGKLVLDALQPSTISDDTLVQKLTVSKRYATTEGFIVRIRYCDFENQLDDVQRLARKLGFMRHIIDQI
jgi:Holliday junction resolvase RusA-like endonuclease